MCAEKVTTYSFEKLGKDAFPIMLYIGPTIEYYSDYEGCTVKNLITDEVFKEIAEMGVNLICGHWENRREIDAMLDLCAKYNILYLPRLDLQKYGFAYYDFSQKRIVCYNEYSEEKKAQVKAEYIAEVSKYKDHPAFGGVCAGDEPGSDVIEGYVEMKKIFDEVAPGKFFYVNMLGPDSESLPCLKFNPFCCEAGEAENMDKEQITWLDVIYNYANTVGLDVMCYDNYICWNNMIRPVLLRDIDRLRRGSYHPKALWTAIIAGTFWEGGETGFPGQSKAETFYQSNLAIAGGCCGLLIFPGFSPIELAHTEQRSFYDRVTGEKTEYYYWYKELFAHIHKCEKVLMNSVYKGLIKTGINGGDISTEKVVQFEQHLEKQGTGDTVVHTSLLLGSFEQLVGVNSTNTQVVVGCYNYDGKTAFYLTNNSASIATEITLTFSENVNVYSVDNAEEKMYQNMKSLKKQLNGGDGVLYVVETVK